MELVFFPCNDVKDNTETKMHILYSLWIYQILSALKFCCIMKLSSEMIDIHSCSTACFPEAISEYFLSFCFISCLYTQYK